MNVGFRISDFAPAERRFSPRRASPHPHSPGFTIVEIVIALTIIIIISAASVPTLKGLRDEQRAREPIQELVRMAKEARLRAMKEKRPYQVAFTSTSFTASRYFNPYLQLSELTEFLTEVETGEFRRNPNEDPLEMDLDSGATDTPKSELPLAPVGPKLDDHWSAHYPLPQDTQYSIEFWHDVQPTEVTGEVVKLWVFQPSGICQPLKIHLQRNSAIFEVEFAALTADIVRETIDLQ